MSQDTSHQIADNTSAITDGKQETIPQNGNNGVTLNNDASQALVQCLLIAARRGRQIRLARAALLDLQQGGSESIIEQMSQPNEA